MGIDGIGSKGPLPPPAAGPPAGPSRATPAERPFEVTRTTATAPAEASRTALERLKAGEIDVDGYVDAKVHEATAHLAPLAPERLAEIRAALRDRMASDPTLVDLVRTAAGRAPSLPDDG